jgi:diketogulonate reductase-like aldo/keto reductase
MARFNRNGIVLKKGGGSKSDKAQKAIEDAISAGYRLLDGAEFYKNEEQVGKAIKNKIRDGTIKREDVFVVSKVIIKMSFKLHSIKANQICYLSRYGTIITLVIWSFRRLKSRLRRCNWTMSIYT